MNPTTRPATRPGRHALVAGEVVGEDHGEERRGGVEDGGQAAGDVPLRPGDQAEGHDIVEKAHDEIGAPRGAVARHGGAGRAHGKVEQGAADDHAEGDDGEGRQDLDGDGDVEIRAAPQQRQGDEQRPFGGRHRAVNGGRHRRSRAISVMAAAQSPSRSRRPCIPIPARRRLPAAGPMASRRAVGARIPPEPALPPAAGVPFLPQLRAISPLWLAIPICYAAPGFSESVEESGHTMAVQLAVGATARNDAGIAAALPLLKQRFGERYADSEAIRRAARPHR